MVVQRLKGIIVLQETKEILQALQAAETWSEAELNALEFRYIYCFVALETLPQHK